MKRMIVALIVGALFLASCQPTPTPPPPTDTAAPPTATVAPATETVAPATETLAPPTDIPIPTEDATQVFGLAETAVVGTQTAEVAETVVSEPTATFIPWTLTPTAQINCEVTVDSPLAADSPFAVNAPFDGKWTIKNTSDKDWLGTQTDIKYISGQKFQTKGDVFDAPADVAKGGSFDFVVDMKAPGSAGSYHATWGLYNSGILVCSMPVAITVK